MSIRRAKQVLRQTRARILRGVTTTKGKLISIFEPDAQILRRGKLHKPTEFGAMVKVQEADGGIVTDIGLVPDKADAPLLVPAVEKHIEALPNSRAAERRRSSPPTAASTRARANGSSASSACTTPPFRNQAIDRKCASRTSGSDGFAGREPGEPAEKLASPG